MKAFRVNLFFYGALFLVFLYGLGIFDLVQNGFKGNILLLTIEAVRYLFLEVLPYWWLMLIVIPLVMSLINWATYLFLKNGLKLNESASLIMSSALFIILISIYLTVIDVKYLGLIILGLMICETLKFFKQKPAQK